MWRLFYSLLLKFSLPFIVLRLLIRSAANPAYRARMRDLAFGGQGYARVTLSYAHAYIALGKAGVFKKVRSLEDAQEACARSNRICQFWMRRTLDGTRRHFAKALARILLWEGRAGDRKLAGQLGRY